MQPKTLKTLGLVTIAVAVVAGVVSTMKGGNTSAAAETETGPLFPQLHGRVNDVALLKIANKDGSFDVARTDGQWGMPAKGHFPVDFAKVKEVVLAIAKLEKVEKKTKNPSLFTKLGVEDVSAIDAQSTQVILADGAGAELAAVLIGNNHARAAGGGDPNIYARKVGENQSWQCAGRVFIEANEGNWLQKEIVALGQERVASATTTHPDGETLVVAKTAPEDANWTVQGVPEGRELSWAGAGDTIARAVQRLSLQDVKPAADVELDEAAATVTEFATFDGLVLTAHVVDQGEDSLIRLSAALDPSLRSDQAPGPPPSEDPEAEEAEATPETPAVGKSLEEVEAEVLELNERFAPWVYIVPSYTASNLRKRVDELLKPLETEAPAGFDAGTPGLGGAGEPETLEDLFPDGIPPEIQQAIDQAEAPGLPGVESAEDIDGENPLDPILKDDEELVPADSGDNG